MSAAAPFRPIVLTPTFNNGGTLERILSEVESLGIPLLIVNDGCTDQTREVLTRWDGSTGPRRAIVVHHDRNRGKAAALRTGFAAARAAGFTHAATIDTDGQLEPSDLPALLVLAERHPRALILGARSEQIEHCPPKNLFARRLSNTAIRLQTGVHISDSQCGLRVYPLALMQMLKVASGRFGFEAEVITRAAWAGCSVLEIPVRCTYPPGNARVTHYRPRRDTPRAVLMHVRLLVRSWIPWPHARWS